MSTETTNKKIKIDNGKTFGRTYTDKAVDERLQGLVSTATFTPVKEKANNSLQKPAGLTKTELVGVGTNGQENIEIGDNLTLANGKLSAMGGGEGTLIINLSEYLSDTDFNDFVLNVFNKKSISKIYDFTNTIETTGINNIELNVNYSGLNIKFYFRRVLTNYGTFFVCEFTWSNNPKNQTIMYLYGGLFGDTISQFKLMIFTDYYSHFITLTDSTNNIAIYLTIQSTNETEFTADTLASYLVDKKVLANGNLHGVVPTYIAGEGGVIKIYYMTPGDNNINPTPDEYQDLSSFTITDLVTLVE